MENLPPMRSIKMIKESLRTVILSISVILSGSEESQYRRYRDPSHSFRMTSDWSSDRTTKETLRTVILSGTDILYSQSHWLILLSATRVA